MSDPTMVSTRCSSWKTSATWCSQLRAATFLCHSSRTTRCTGFLRGTTARCRLRDSCFDWSGLGDIVRTRMITSLICVIFQNCGRSQRAKLSTSAKSFLIVVYLSCTSSSRKNPGHYLHKRRRRVDQRESVQEHTTAVRGTATENSRRPNGHIRGKRRRERG